MQRANTYYGYLVSESKTNTFTLQSSILRVDVYKGKHLLSMRLFKTVPMGTLDIGIIKLAVGCIALAIGATWADKITPYVTPLVIIGIATGLYAFSSWIKK